MRETQSSESTYTIKNYNSDGTLTDITYHQDFPAKSMEAGITSTTIYGEDGNPTYIIQQGGYQHNHLNETWAAYIEIQEDGTAVRVVYSDYDIPDNGNDYGHENIVTVYDGVTVHDNGAVEFGETIERFDSKIIREN